LLLAVPKAAVL